MKFNSLEIQIIHSRKNNKQSKIKNSFKQKLLILIFEVSQKIQNIKEKLIVKLKKCLQYNIYIFNNSYSYK